jgi:hypothetical protein
MSLDERIGGCVHVKTAAILGSVLDSIDDVHCKQQRRHCGLPFAFWFGNCASARPFPVRRAAAASRPWACR